MSWLLTAIPTGITAFTATNLDDLVILTLLFSQVNSTFRSRHIILGQYLGFCVLLLASLPGFLGGVFLPESMIGLLGLIPITLGFKQLLVPTYDSSTDSTETELVTDSNSIFSSIFSPQTCSVASIAIANGSDNISIYVPLFASSKLSSLLIIVSVFLVMVGVWCFATYKLTRQSEIADILTRYGNSFVPYVLIGLGIFIILDSQALSPLALGSSSLCLAGIMKLHGMSKNNAEVPKIEKS